ASNPLGFSNQAKRYLEFKKRRNLPSFRNIERYISLAMDHFKDTNVKHIKKRHLRDFLFGIPNISEKTRSNYASQLHDFYYHFLYDEEEILTLADLPKIPDIPFELGFRKITDIETREKIMDKLKETTYHRNPKIWLAIDLLCAYNNIRPVDITRLKECDIDLEYGVLTFWRPSKSKNKRAPKVIRIRLLDYHLTEFKRLKKAYPAIQEMPFFRHTEQRGIKADTPFFQNYLYKQWKKVCALFDIHDLDLYGGTRHTTTTAIAKVAGKKKARIFSGHDTNKAFDRYCQIGEKDSHDMAELMAKMRGKVVRLDQIKKRK
ncbi:MAG: hypothetical protein MI739_06620, partial [Bacteroidales bacterium]|nr:hypothetical protein [Bacteroidales bacterium]